MATVKRVYSQPNASSLKEGEEVVYLGQGKPLARYRKEGGQVWVSYMTTNGNLFVEKDFNVQGTISQGGSGGGSGPPIVKGGLIEQTAGGVGVSTAGTTGAVSYDSGTPAVGTLAPAVGGTGQDLSGSTGAISVSSGTVSAGTLATSIGGTGQNLGSSTGAISIDSGTVSAGTLPVNKGGTAATNSNTWLNSRITTSADGTLNYDGTTAVDPSLTSISGTLTVAKGGTGETDSNTWLNSRITTNANGTLNYDATGATAPNIENIAGTLTIAKGGTGATDSNAWLNSRIEMNTNGTLDYSASGSGAVTMNTLTDDNNIRARVTGSLQSANGLKSGVSIGDAVQTAVIFNGLETMARSDDDSTITNSVVWQQSDTTQVIKASFNYLHNTANRGLKLSCLLRSSSGSHNAVATLSVYPQSVSSTFDSGSLPDTSSSAIISVTLSTNKLYFDSTHTSNMLAITTGSGSGELADGTLYKVTIGLHSANASETAYMSAPTVVAYGSSS